MSDSKTLPLILISPWFGPWPSWINLHFLSCAGNPEIKWLIPTDQEPPECRPENIRFMPMSFGHFCDRVSDTVGLRFAPSSTYKVCDIKPMLGHVFDAEITDYRSWGYADQDIVFGNIRKFYPDRMLSAFDAISTHADKLSGHLAVFANTARMRLAYRRRRAHWRRAVTSQESIFFDEAHFENVFRPRGFFQKPFAMKSYSFVEQHSTIDDVRPWLDGRTDHPRTWVWRNGRLTNTDDGDTEFLYLHFMNWRSDRYRRASRGPAPWPKLTTPLIQVDWRRAAEEGFVISPQGILPIDAAGTRGAAE